MAGAVLARQDVALVPGDLRVTLSCSKTIRTQAVSLILPAIPASRLCPVWAWHRVECQVPAPSDAPTFLAHTGAPLTLRKLNIKAIVTPSVIIHVYMVLIALCEYRL